MGFIVLGIIATAMVIYFLSVYKRAGKTVAFEIVYAKAWKNKFEAERISIKLNQLKKKNAKYHTLSEKQFKKKVDSAEKQMKAYATAYKQYLGGKKFDITDALAMFGYQLLADFKIDGNNDLYRNLVSDCEHSGYLELEKDQETNGKKNSSIYAYYILGSTIAFVFAGVLIGILLLMLMLVAGRGLRSSFMVAFVVAAAMFLFGYLSYDTIRTLAVQRTDEIDRDFPNALSKITLLIIAGANITKALEQTVQSGDGLIYSELGLVIEETERGATMEHAFARMQGRCKNEFLDRFIAIITKSYTSGNSNLAESLRNINTDCWLAKKHGARRMSETISGKLYIPTMLMFVGILVVIIVPMMSSFSGF